MDAAEYECHYSDEWQLDLARTLERELAEAAAGVAAQNRVVIAQANRIVELERSLSDSPTWIATDGYDPERPKDGEKVLGWWPKNSVFEGGMESLTFHAADEDGRSDTWTNAFGDSADAPDYWARVKGPK